MSYEGKTLNEIDLKIMQRQLLLNSKLLSLIENQRAVEPIQLFKIAAGQLVLFNPKKNSLYFSTATEPASALAMYTHLKTSYLIKVIEGPVALTEKIAAYLKKTGANYRSAKMLLLCKETDVSMLSCAAEFEFVNGACLNDFGADILVAKFSSERLNITLDEQEAKKLILSSTKEFIGLKIKDEMVSIAAWIREVHGYRGLSYVYTHEQYRGQGFSQLLLAQLMSTLGDKYKGAFLFVEEVNIPAVNLYHKLGFKDSGCFSQIKLM